jgi:hypothetical protein
MRNALGQFVKGENEYPENFFKKGQHWRPWGPHRDKQWLIQEYVTNQRSAMDIAHSLGLGEGAVLYWLKKHQIPCRSVAETRRIHPRPGLRGERCPSYGRRGPMASNWKGGCTPERNAFYARAEWTAAAREVWARDRARCRRCGKKSARDGRLHIHHIVSFAVEESRAKPDNLVLLCQECHHWVHSAENTGNEFIDRASERGHPEDVV